MNRFGQIFEDPSYDEDGVLAEEQDWEDVQLVEELVDLFDPFNTVNS